MIAAMAYKLREDKNRRRIREHEWFKKRDEKGTYAEIFQELYNDASNFKKHIRMTPEIFDVLLELVRPSIEKKDTHMRKSIPAGWWASYFHISVVCNSF